MSTNQPQILLSDIVSVERFIADIAADRIQERIHPDSPDLRIYSYTKKTQFGGLWTAESRLARGLILDVPAGDFERATVQSRGLPKFFTVEQTESDWGRAKLVDDDENVVVDEAPEIPWEMPAVVSEKLNGALGLGYIDPSGRFRISTKGSFGSLEAKVANRVLDSKYAELVEELSDRETYGASTMLFEIITPERPHPVDYGDLEDLIYLGSIDNRSGVWLPATAGCLAQMLGFPIAKTMEVNSLREAVELPYEDNTEGFVVTVRNAGPEAIYKVKPAQYLQLRRLFYALQESELQDFVSAQSFTDQLLEIEGPESIDFSPLVGELKLNRQMEAMLESRRTSTYEKIVAPAQKLIAEVAEELQSLGDLQTMARGDVARAVKTKAPDLQGLYFAVYGDLTARSTKRANGIAVRRVVDSI